MVLVVKRIAVLDIGRKDVFLKIVEVSDIQDL